MGNLYTDFATYVKGHELAQNEPGTLNLDNRVGQPVRAKEVSHYDLPHGCYTFPFPHKHVATTIQRHTDWHIKGRGEPEK